MKIYVDELPKSCLECKFCNKENYCCLLMQKDVREYRDDCPLILIQDHDKQVRKEVCDYIKHRLDNVDVETNTDYNSFIAILDEVLDQIQGEIDGKGIN